MSPYDFTHVLVPIDGSEGAQKALDCALSLGAAVGAEVTALAVEGKLAAYAASLGEVEGDLLLGSTADRVAHHAHCPVMVVR